MISKITRSGHVEATKENGYKVQGQLSEELLQALFLWVEAQTSPEEIADKLIRDNADEKTAPDFIDLYDPWDPKGKDYKIHDDGRKDRVRDLDQEGNWRLYQIIQPHKSQEDRRPRDTPALWLDLTHHEAPPGEYPTWKQPTGGHDAYKIGDIVWHKEKLWICTEVDGAGNNSWEPGEYGWEEYME